MKTEKIYIQHEENKKWMNSLLFYEDEINIMKKRLEELASGNSDKEVLIQVEHFQNQLIIQKDQIDQLKHEINLDNDILTSEMDRNNAVVDHRKVKDHSSIRIRMEVFERIFNSIRKELNAFIEKYL
jgi:hypothetical protein